MHYTLSHLWSEARLARRRMQAQVAAQTLGFFAAAAQVLAGGESLNNFLLSMQSDVD